MLKRYVSDWLCHHTGGCSGCGCVNIQWTMAVRPSHGTEHPLVLTVPMSTVLVCYSGWYNTQHATATPAVMNDSSTVCMLE